MEEKMVYLLKELKETKEKFNEKLKAKDVEIKT